MPEPTFVPNLPRYNWRMKRKMFNKLHLGQPRRLTAGLTRHEHPAVAPDGRFLAYYCGEYGSIHVFVTDMRGRLARRVSPNSGNSTQPAWHPTGLRIAYRHQQPRTRSGSCGRPR